MMDKAEAQRFADSGEQSLAKMQAEAGKIAETVSGQLGRLRAIQTAVQIAPHIAGCTTGDVKTLTEFFYAFVRREDP